MRGLIAKSLGSQAAQAEVIVEGQRSVQARIRHITGEDLANITGAAAGLWKITPLRDKLVRRVGLKLRYICVPLVSVEPKSISASKPAVDVAQ